MGLDSYLYAEQYFSGYSFKSEDDQRKYADVVMDSGLMAAVDPESPTAYVRVVVAYWRKANAIHRWFVENVQDGEDECRPSSTFERDKLLELREDCMAVINDPDIAEERLPTQEGFFFGDTDYDEWYMQDMKNTVEQIDRVLANTPDDVSFIYQSSW